MQYVHLDGEVVVVYLLLVENEVDEGGLPHAARRGDDYVHLVEQCLAQRFRLFHTVAKVGCWYAACHDKRVGVWWNL